MRAGRRHRGELRQGDLLQERLLERCSAEVGHLRLSEVRGGTGGSSAASGSSPGERSASRSGEEVFVCDGAAGDGDGSAGAGVLSSPRTVMRLVALLGVMLAGAASADELPQNACLGNQSAGDDCLTENGTPGTCIELRYEIQPHPKAPITIQTELVCQVAVAGTERAALPWIGAGLSFLAMCTGVATRRRPSTVTA